MYRSGSSIHDAHTRSYAVMCSLGISTARSRRKPRRCHGSARVCELGKDQQSNVEERLVSRDGLLGHGDHPIDPITDFRPLARAWEVGLTCCSVIAVGHEGHLGRREDRDHRIEAPPQHPLLRLDGTAALRRLHEDRRAGLATTIPLHGNGHSGSRRSGGHPIRHRTGSIRDGPIRRMTHGSDWR